MKSDLRFAIRSLVRTPGFTAIALLTLALGIGMNTAMFSMLNSFLIRPLSFPHADQLFRLDRKTPQQPFDNHSAQNVADLVPASANTADLAIFRFWAFTLSENDQPADTPIAVRVSQNFFEVLGVRLQLGRTFVPEEDAVGKNNVIVISHRYWQSRFAADPNIVGRVVRLDGSPAEIIGVMAPEDDMLRIIAPAGIFRPLALTNEERATRTDNSLGIIGRYRAGVSREQAASQFDAIAQRLVQEHPQENANMSFGVRSLQSTTLTGSGRNTTFMLVGLSGFVLLIACANLANLLLARAISRSREFSIRGALGASRNQLIRPLVIECLVLAVVGGLVAMLVSAWTTDWLSMRFGDDANPVNFSADGRVMLFALSASVLTAFLFGVAPAWWASRIQINDALKSGARGTLGSRSQNHFRQLLIVTQFALALVLLVGAGFFIRGLDRLLGSKTGWDPDPVVSGVVNLASANYSNAETIIAFHTALRERLLSYPGVANASVCFEIPLFNPPQARNYLVEGREAPPPGEELVAFTNGVSASFMDTMGMRLLRGRFFDQTDQLTSRPVVVINDSMARTLFAGEDAVGQRIAVAGGSTQAWAEIVGVVEDVRALNVTPSRIRFQVYKPFTQEAWQYVTIAVRATDAKLSLTLVDPIRKAVAAIDPDQPVFRLMPVPQRIARNFGVWETINQLFILFAVLGLLLAALGIYGVISRLVVQRTGEIGIRMALGAQVRDILRLILGNGLRMATIGAVVGVIGSIFLSRVINQALPAFGGSYFMPIAAACGLLMTVALLACWLPAYRASRVSPTEALRAE